MIIKGNYLQMAPFEIREPWQFSTYLGWSTTRKWQLPLPFNEVVSKSHFWRKKLDATRYHNGQTSSESFFDSLFTLTDHLAWKRMKPLSAMYRLNPAWLTACRWMLDDKSCGTEKDFGGVESALASSTMFPLRAKFANHIYPAFGIETHKPWEGLYSWWLRSK